MNARKRIALGLSSTALVLGAAGAGIAAAAEVGHQRARPEAAGRRGRPRSPPTSG